MSDEIQLASDAPVLSKRESQALAVYTKTGGMNISPTTQAQMFVLYLNGKSCDEIQKLNHGFHLGAIVRARLDGEWDKRLAEYRKELLDSVSLRARQTVFESVHFVSDLLAATHKFHGEKVARYLQTGNEEELGGLEVKSIGNYKAMVEMLLKLTGQDQNSKVQHSITVEQLPVNDTAPTSLQASQILAILEGKKTQ